MRGTTERRDCRQAAVSAAGTAVWLLAAAAVLLWVRQAFFPSGAASVLLAVLAAVQAAGLIPLGDYANERGAVLLFDAAYESFITDGDVPHSIYEVNGAETCAIEFCSFSKTAGFTGTRCSYTVVPQALVRGSLHLNAMWLRRQTTKYNGVPYIVQRAAAAVFTEETGKWKYPMQMKEQPEDTKKLFAASQEIMSTEY